MSKSLFLVFVMSTLVILLLTVNQPVLAHCYGGPCGNSDHKPGDVSWFDALASNAGWGEGPPCNSCHTTSKKVSRPKRSRPATKNFPQLMPKREFLKFHGQAVKLTKNKGPLKNKPENQVPSKYRQAYRWIGNGK